MIVILLRVVCREFCLAGVRTEIMCLGPEKHLSAPTSMAGQIEYTHSLEL